MNNKRKKSALFILSAAGCLSLCSGAIAALLRLSFIGCDLLQSAPEIAGAVFFSLISVAAFASNDFENWYRFDFSPELEKMLIATGKGLIYPIKKIFVPIWIWAKRKPAAESFREAVDRLDQWLEISLEWFFFQSIIFKIMLLAIVAALIYYEIREAPFLADVFKEVPPGS